MLELQAAGCFYRELEPQEQAELVEAIAEDIYFLEEDLQHQILETLQEADPELAEAVLRRNRFTL